MTKELLNMIFILGSSGLLGLSLANLVEYLSSKNKNKDHMKFWQASFYFYAFLIFCLYFYIFLNILYST